MTERTERTLKDVLEFLEDVSESWDTINRDRAWKLIREMAVAIDDLRTSE